MNRYIILIRPLLIAPYELTLEYTPKWIVDSTAIDEILE